jgi:hypothetical protein
MKTEPIAIITALVVFFEGIAAIVGLPAWVYPAAAVLGLLGRQFVSPVGQ